MWAGGGAVRESGTTCKSRDKVGHNIRLYFFILMTTLEGGALVRGEWGVMEKPVGDGLLCRLCDA